MKLIKSVNNSCNTDSYIVELSIDEIKVLFDALSHCTEEHCDQQLYGYFNHITKEYTYHDKEQRILTHLYDTLFNELKR